MQNPDSQPTVISKYRQASNIKRTKFQNLNVSRLSYSCLCAIYWSPVLSQWWRSSWSSTDRQCSNYIWVITNLMRTKVRVIITVAPTKQNGMAGDYYMNDIGKRWLPCQQASPGSFFITVNRKCDNTMSYKVDEAIYISMMTSSNGNIFRVTGPLCGEFIGDRWIPRTKASDAELCCFLWSAPEQTAQQTS